MILAMDTSTPHCTVAFDGRSAGVVAPTGHAEHLASLDPTDSRELGEVAWFTLDDCRGLDLPTVTRAVLEVVQRRLAGEATDVPFWRWSRGNPDSAI